MQDAYYCVELPVGVTNLVLTDKLWEILHLLDLYITVAGWHNVQLHTFRCIDALFIPYKVQSDLFVWNL